MAIAETSVIELTQNGPSDWVKLQDSSVVNIDCGTWGDMSVLLEYSRYGSDETAKSVVGRFRDHEVVARQNWVKFVYGPGYVRGVVSNYSGTPVLFRVG